MTYNINKNFLFGILLRTRKSSKKRQNNVYICIAFTRNQLIQNLRLEQVFFKKSER